MSGTSKFISAALIAALLATVAIAHTMQTRGAGDAPTVQSTQTTQPAHRTANATAPSATVGMAPGGSVPSAGAPLRNFACAPSLRTTCDKLDWFPE